MTTDKAWTEDPNFKKELQKVVAKDKSTRQLQQVHNLLLIEKIAQGCSNFVCSIEISFPQNMDCLFHLFPKKKNMGWIKYADCV